MLQKMAQLDKSLKVRSSGDGMDNALLTSTEILLQKSNIKLKYRPSEEILKSLQPVQPRSPIITSVPKYVPKERKHPKFLIGKPKEPKFVPYEPYKGAVEPIIPPKQVLKRNVSKPVRNNVDIQDLVTQMTEFRTSELNKSKEEVQNDEQLISLKQWQDEKKAFETDIKNLRETNSHLENQVKFQTQVNSELKTLLVAAVGEDLESRVQHLTEDKLQLARALLNSANHLTSHQEQTEWLSGQCEVWRSKFLASSLMVEELAKWKSALSNRMSELQETIKNLLEERRTVRKQSLKTYKCLSHIWKHLNHLSITHEPLKTTNTLELTDVNSCMSQDLLHYLVKDCNYEKTSDTNIVNLQKNTPAEEEALKILKNPITLANKLEVCNALVGATMSLGRGQMYLQHPSPHVTCCSHCKGEIKNI